MTGKARGGLGRGLAGMIPTGPADRQRRADGLARRGLAALIPTGPTADGAGRRVGRAPAPTAGPPRRHRPPPTCGGPARRRAGRPGWSRDTVAGARLPRDRRSTRSGRTRSSRGTVVRRGGAGRARRTRSASSACCSRSWSARPGPAATSWSWASAGGGPRSAPASTTIPAIVRRTERRRRCCATRCWRTSTGCSSTRWRRRRPTSSCSTEFGVTHERAGRPARPQPAGRLQHDPAAQAAGAGAAPGGGRCAVRRARPGAARPGRRRRGRRSSPPGSSPRACRSGRPRRRCALARRRGARIAAAAAPQARRPGLEDLADRLSDTFDTRVQVELGQRKGRIVVEFASVGGPGADRRR